MTLHEGSRVKGIYDGHKFTGDLYQLNHICTILLDRGYVDSEDRYHDRHCMYLDQHDKSRTFEEIPDSPVNSEYAVGELSSIAKSSLARQYKHVNLATYRETIERRLTTYTTKKVTVTCEYGCKHTIDQRVEVKPVINETHLAISFFFYALAEYAHYLDTAEYMAKNETWNHLASKLAGSCIAYDGDYGDLPACQVRQIQRELKAQYETLCNDYIVKIYGKHINRHISDQSRISGGQYAQRLNTYLQGK